jgi:hypothetical protein
MTDAMAARTDAGTSPSATVPTVSSLAAMRSLRSLTR